ncbi:hypothetical protein [Siccibacter colletis]|uniref:hypothetical protein n=1 Tax=Siccibacter colletis TaxID=1505757 RepID=UPI0004E150E7|nr:hypothetical protein [Siccibacter colletis]
MMNSALTATLLVIIWLIIGYHIDNLVIGCYFQGYPLVIRDIHWAMIKPLFNSAAFGMYIAGEYYLLRRKRFYPVSLISQAGLLLARLMTLAVILFLYRYVDPLMRNVEVAAAEVAISADDIDFYRCYILAMVIPPFMLYLRATLSYAPDHPRR